MLETKTSINTNRLTQLAACFNQAKLLLPLKALFVATGCTLVAISGCGPTPEQRAAMEKRRLERIEQKKIAFYVDQCEDKLKDVLKDPFSYRPISRGGRYYFEKYKPAKYYSTGSILTPRYNGYALLEYTAANSYGGNIRGDYVCYFSNNEIVATL